MGTTVVNNQAVDPTGKTFLSYRRSRVEEVSRLAQCLREHGVPTWKDVDDLGSEATVEGLEGALSSVHTSGGLVWVSRDLGESSIIMREEIPSILRRARLRNGFRAHLVLADGLDYSEVQEILAIPNSIEDPAKTWNIIKPPAGASEHEIVRFVTAKVLGQRLQDLHGFLPSESPLRMRMSAHGQAVPGFEPGIGLAVDWHRRFSHRHASPDIWRSVLAPTLDSVRRAVRANCPGRHILADGQLSIAGGLLLGRAFAEPGGLRLSWVQAPANTRWGLDISPEPSGMSARLDSHNAQASDLAVLVHISASVEGAVTASRESLPKFRAILRVGPEGGAPAVELATPGQATDAARLIGTQIRAARQKYPEVERVHIFMAGPVGMAIMVGQQLNAVGPVHTYEHDQQSGGIGMYRAAAVLSDPVA